MRKTDNKRFHRRIPQGQASQVGPMISLACFEHRHEDCPLDCKPMLPFPCGCSCHQKKPLTT